MSVLIDSQRRTAAATGVSGQHCPRCDGAIAVEQTAVCNGHIAGTIAQRVTLAYCEHCDLTHACDQSRDGPDSYRTIGQFRAGGKHLTGAGFAKALAGERGGPVLRSPALGKDPEEGQRRKTAERQRQYLSHPRR